MTLRKAGIAVLGLVLILASVYWFAARPALDEAAGDFPRRAEESPFYLNQSGITGADLLARRQLERARELTNIDFNMVLLADIPADYTVEDYANKLSERWKIGSKHSGRGVLILLVEKRNALKIEVSYELEPLFTDAFCESFQDQIQLYFASRQFGDVLENLITTMAAYALNPDNDDARPDLPARLDLAYGATVEATFLSGGGGVLKSNYFYDKEQKLAQILMLDRATVDEFKASRDPDETVRRYLRSLELGLNYPFLDVLVEGSQYMRMEYPKSLQFLSQQHADYLQAMPYRIKLEGDLGVVRFRNNSPTFPLFLRRDDQGMWRIDVAKAWALMARSYDFKSMKLTHTDHPWMFAFHDFSYEPTRMPPIPDVGFPLNLKERIATLEQAIREHPEVADNYFRLGDIFYWECYWIASAIDVVEKGLALEPDRIDYHWLAIEMRHHYPLIDGIPGHYDAILRQNSKDMDALYKYSNFCRVYLKDTKRAKELRARYDELK